MTARKPKTQALSGDVHPDDAHGSGQTVSETTHEAEHEQDVVSEAKPTYRISAVAIADALTSLDGDYHDGLDAFVGAASNGNRLTITVTDPDTELVQTFHATVEEGIREF